MHILAFENKPTLHAGGQERSLHEVLKGLAGYGHEVSLVYGEEGELLDESYQHFCSNLIKAPSRVFRMSKMTEVVQDLIKIWFFEGNETVDLLYVNQYPDLPLPALLSKLTGIPLVCHLRLPAPHYLSRQYRWGLNQCELLIAISKQTRKTYIEQGIDDNKISVLHNAIDTSEFNISSQIQPDSKADGASKEILYLGRLCPPKGIEVLIEAAKKLLASHENTYRFQIVGNVRGAGVDASYMDRLEKLSKPYLHNGIHFSGHRKSIIPIIQSSDLVVVPSVWEEPFGRVIIEAMACGVPVVASNTGGITEILKPTFSAMLVPPGDAKALADNIKLWAGKHKEDATLSKKLRKEVKTRFALQDYIPKISAIFEDTINAEKA